MSKSICSRPYRSYILLLVFRRCGARSVQFAQRRWRTTPRGSYQEPWFMQSCAKRPGMLRRRGWDRAERDYALNGTRRNGPRAKHPDASIGRLRCRSETLVVAWCTTRRTVGRTSRYWIRVRATKPRGRCRDKNVTMMPAKVFGGSANGAR